MDKLNYLNANSKWEILQYKYIMMQSVVLLNVSNMFNK